MTFLVEHYYNDTLCLIKICLNKKSPGECLIQAFCGFQWSIVESTNLNDNSPTSNNNLASDTTVPIPTTVPTPTSLPTYGTPGVDNTSMVEPCAANTWLWVVDTAEEGEAHFLVENNILNNVSTIHWFS